MCVCLCAIKEHCILLGRALKQFFGRKMQKYAKEQKNCYVRFAAASEKQQKTNNKKQETIVNFMLPNYKYTKLYM